MRIGNKTKEQTELVHLDRAFLNSILSYALYTKNANWFEPWSQIKSLNPEEYLSENHILKGNFSENRAHDRAFAIMINKVFSPVLLNLEQKGLHTSENYLYKFTSEYRSGIYKSLANLAAACAMKSQNEDGTFTLHISFRGTDTKARKFMDYLRMAYPDMKAYYDSFKPFENAILQYINNADNKISKLEVSGHSLGGSMVQHFLKSPEINKIKIPIEGFTYGSPSAISNPIYSLLLTARHAVIMKNFKNMVKPVIPF